MSKGADLWLLAGMDPSGGAGLSRDAWAVRKRAPELEFAAVVTTFTDQGSGRPARSIPGAERHFETSLARLREAGWPRAIKIGLLPDALVAALTAVLRVRPSGTWVVCDPVLRASDGGSMGASPEGLESLLETVDLITPNRAEAEALSGVEATRSAQWLHRRYGSAVLVKSAEKGEDWIGDHYVPKKDGAKDAAMVSLRRQRLEGSDPRGTGCALSSAIAAGVARGNAPDDALRVSLDALSKWRQRVRIGPDGRVHMG